MFLSYFITAASLNQLIFYDSIAQFILNTWFLAQTFIFNFFNILYSIENVNETLIF